MSRVVKGLSSRLLCKPIGLIKKLMEVKQQTPVGKKPAPVKTYLRNAIITPEMVGGVVEVHNGMTFKKINIREDMILHYLGEFAPTRKHNPFGTGKSRKNRAKARGMANQSDPKDPKDPNDPTSSTSPISPTSITSKFAKSITPKSAKSPKSPKPPKSSSKSPNSSKPPKSPRK